MTQHLYQWLAGRCSRRLYWLAIAIALLFFAAASYLITSIFGTLHGYMYIIWLVPFSIVQIPRWHDTDRSAWYALWGLAPGFNILIAIILGLIPGTKGANRYGEVQFRRQDHSAKAI
jgi:uncharacterized membrane protein YhaH (DUF805 family)